MSDRILGNIIQNMNVNSTKLVRVMLFDDQINKSQNTMIKPRPGVLGGCIEPEVRSLYDTAEWGYNEVKNGFVLRGESGLYTIGFNTMCIIHEGKEMVNNRLKIRVYYDDDNYWTVGGGKQKVVYLERNSVLRLQYGAIENISVPGDFVIAPSTLLLFHKI